MKVLIKIPLLLLLLTSNTVFSQKYLDYAKLENIVKIVDEGKLGGYYKAGSGVTEYAQTYLPTPSLTNTIDKVLLQKIENEEAELLLVYMFINSATDNMQTLAEEMNSVLQGKNPKVKNDYLAKKFKNAKFFPPNKEGALNAEGYTLAPLSYEKWKPGNLDFQFNRDVIMFINTVKGVDNKDIVVLNIFKPSKKYINLIRLNNRDLDEGTKTYSKAYFKEGQEEQKFSKMMKEVLDGSRNCNYDQREPKEYKIKKASIYYKLKIDTKPYFESVSYYIYRGVLWDVDFIKFQSASFADEQSAQKKLDEIRKVLLENMNFNASEKNKIANIEGTIYSVKNAKIFAKQKTINYLPVVQKNDDGGYTADLIVQVIKDNNYRFGYPPLPPSGKQTVEEQQKGK